MKELIEVFSQDIASGWAFAILNEAGQSVGEIENALSSQGLRPTSFEFSMK